MSYHICAKCKGRPEREVDPSKSETVPVYRRAEVACRVKRIKCFVVDGKATLKVVH